MASPQSSRARMILIALASIAVLALTFLAGARYQAAISQPQLKWALKRLAVSKQEVTDIDSEFSAMNEEWWTQLRFMVSPPEPTRPVRQGVYLCRLNARETSAPVLVVDFVATAGPHGVILNDSPFTQRFRLAERGSVYAVDEPSRGELSRPAVLYEIPQTTFYRELESGSATGTAFSNACWWVTVYDTDRAAQLIQAPSQ